MKGQKALYQEGAPERKLKKELKARQRQIAAQERREKRMQELEEALAAEGFETENKEEAPAVLVKKSGKKRQKKASMKDLSSEGFLAGTDLSGNRSTGETSEQEFPLNPENAVNPEMLASAEENESAVDEEKISGISGEDDLAVDGRDFHEDTQLQFAIHRSEPVQSEVAQAEWAEPETSGFEMEEPESVQPYTDKKVSDNQHAAVEEDNSYDGVDFKEAMATTAMQPAKNPKSSKQEIANGIVNIQHEINTQEAAVKKEYQYPPVNLLKRGNGKSQGDSDSHLRKTAQKLQEILYNFGVNAKVTNVSCGPTVTRYELQPEMGVKVSKIVGLSDDIKLNLAAPDIRIEAPIPGKAAVGIEVPNKENSPVMLRDLIQSPEFMNAKSKLAFAAGKDIEGKTVVADIAKMPHLLIAGSTAPSSKISTPGSFSHTAVASISFV